LQGLAEGKVDLLAVNYAEGGVSPYNVSRFYDYDPHPCVLYGLGTLCSAFAQAPPANSRGGRAGGRVTFAVCLHWQ
jgi:hypothetical protein